MKILIIEDEKSIAELERDYLEMSGYECDLAASGDTGLEMAVSNDYDLIVLDLMLPGKDGFAVLREIRECKETPIIIISAKNEDIDKIWGLGLGADDYMVKPFSPGELVARVKMRISRYNKLVGMESKKTQNKITAGVMEIDKDSHQVFVNEEEKILTNKEFELLLFLAENPNRVFSKEVLFDRIWGLDAIGDVTTVTVHIRRIREKIEVDSADPQFIETVWGVGYRFKG